MKNKIVLDKILLKVSYRILPIIVLMFVMSMIDRSNIGFVKEYIEIDIGIGDVAYALGAGIFFIGYAIFEIPSNILLHRVGAKIWLSRIMITWGIVTMCMIFIRNETSFYILRFLLGVTEAGFSPGIILYLSYWFPHQNRSRAYGIYQSGVPLALIFSGPFTGWILQYAPSFWFSNWQWMFFIHGGITVIVGIFAFIFLVDKPSKAYWLDENEKYILNQALQEDEKEKHSVSPKTIFSTLIHPLVWKFTFVYFAIQVNVYAVFFYLPTKIAYFLESKVGFEVGLFFMIPWIFTLFLMPLITYFTDKRKTWAKNAIILLLLADIGVSIAAFAPSFFLFIFGIVVAAVGFIAIQPIFWNMPTRFLEGKNAAAGIALIGSFGNLGGFIAPLLKQTIENWTRTSYAGFTILALIGFLGACMLIHLKYKLKIT
ncbi:MFS transporter [Helicobacter sp. 11S03491-1]|uniref:MFS transporter n=1 Tax=Helicobacter sp. 11S03491-1 TaxID=1476196 RepID=UPI000BA56C94|nr:MFS transporter [Helicobacter sp. 11S03491-1]PAF42284.1 MFS transporter [Helicobacter sp. 11S03491-1]